jgi:phage-related protein
MTSPIFPATAKLRAGYELFMVQVGREPADWKPMPRVGPGAFSRAVYVLHAFQKKSQNTSRQDLDLARRRYRDAKEVDEKEQK